MKLLHHQLRKVFGDKEYSLHVEDLCIIAQYPVVNVENCSNLCEHGM